MEIAVSSSPAHIMMTRRKNTWYSTRDGNWNDPNTWMSNALDKKNITCPQAGDDVHIAHTIDYHNTLLSGGYQTLMSAVTLFNHIIGNLYIHDGGKLTALNGGNQCKLFILGNIKSDGVIDFTSTNANLIAIEIWGTDNYIKNFSAGTKSFVIYNSPFAQVIPNLNYCNLIIDGGGEVNLQGDLNISNSLTLNTVISSNPNPITTLGAKSKLELGTYTGNFNSINNGGVLSKSSSGIVNATGLMTFSTASGNGTISFTGNPTVNLYGGISGDCRGGINLGSGIVNVLSNQTWAITNSGNIPTQIGSFDTLIDSGKTLTIQSLSGLTSNLGGWINGGTINGVDSTSMLNIDGTLGYGNSNTIMATGTYNYNHSGNSNIYVPGGVTLTLPQTYYYDLTINGIASLNANTTVSHNLTIGISTASLELSTFDFTCSGTTNLSGGALNKSGGGTVNLSNTICNGSITFLSNPTVNLSGNLSGDVRNGFDFGAGTIVILQSLSIGVWVGGNVAPAITTNILIASGKTLTNIGLGSSLGGITTTGTITGEDNTAILDNRSVLTYKNSIAPMAIGALYCNQSVNTFIYGESGNQDIAIPSDTIPGYSNLTLNGSGTKSLLGNISVKGIYSLVPPATLNVNGFSLTNP